MNLRQHINHATDRLQAAQVDAPRLSAQVLAAHALGCTRLQLMLRAETPLTPAEAAAVDACIERRAMGEPVAYITGHKEFFGRDFTVTPATLIPRPETEHLVETALELCQEASLRFADLGTGSGCIGVTLAAERPHWSGFLLDISAAALHIARQNAADHRVGHRLTFVQGDLCAPPLVHGSLDLLVSNPPYISGEEYATLSHEVRNFEPQNALTPDKTGLTHIRALATQGAHLVRPGGLCLVEHGCHQGADVLHIFTESGQWNDIKICCDIAGLERFCCCRKA